MSMSFTKLFSSLTDSTVWCEPDRVRLVWITMLAMADRKGRIWASVPGLANRARVPVEDAELAIERFSSPDKHSRTPDHDGRRVEKIDGGWRLLNYEKYRAIRDAESVRESKRRYIAARRAAESGSIDNAGTVEKVDREESQTNTGIEVDTMQKQKQKQKQRKDITTLPSLSSPKPDKTARGKPLAATGFDRFWAAFPRKTAKVQAAKAFAKLAPDDGLLDEIIAAVRRDCASDQWRRDGGQYVPYASTWLNGRRWEDEGCTVVPGKVVDIFAGVA